MSCFPKSYSVLFLNLMVLFAQVGCEDGVSPGVGGRVDQGGSSPIIPEADAAVLGDSGGANIVDGGVIEDECVPGTKECVVEGGAEARECGPNGQWNLRRCNPDEICSGGTCENSAIGCTLGETNCLSNGNLAVCDNDRWIDQGACEEGLTCSQGQCVSGGCLAALRGNSYIGCEFLTLDLANSAFDTRDQNFDGQADGTTVDSPTGLVVANNSDVETTVLTLIGPNGMPARVVSRRTIEVPDISIIPPGQYSATTVTSNIRDSFGAIVEDDISVAERLTVPPGGIATLLLPRGRLDWTSASIRKSAFKLSSTQPVVAYQFSPYCCNFSFSNDASLLYPTSSLGASYRYVGPAHHQFFRVNQNDLFGCSATSPCFDPSDTCLNGQCGRYADESAMMTIVGAQDGTQIRVELPPGQEVIGFNGINGQSLTNGFDLDLNAQDVAILPTVYRVSDATDLSGAKITGNKPFSVFSGHVCSFFPSDVFACDHLQEQLVPTSTWGSRYQLVPVAERGSNYPQEVVYWKLVSNSDNTTIAFSTSFGQLGSVGTSNPTMPHCGDMLNSDGDLVLQEGGFCEFGTRSAVQLQSSNPILVAGFLVGQESTAPAGGTPFGRRAGDPSMFLMPTDQQFRADYVFLTPDTYYVDYVTLITPVGNEILLNGEAVDLVGANIIPGSDFIYKHIELTQDGPQSLLGNNPFGIIVYAYDDFVSYAFTGGVNLTKF